MTKEEQDKITHEVIGAAMEVHNFLGNGFQEVVYQRALSIEMKLRNIQHQREFEMPKERMWGKDVLIFLFAEKFR